MQSWLLRGCLQISGPKVSRMSSQGASFLILRSLGGVARMVRL